MPGVRKESRFHPYAGQVRVSALSLVLQFRGGVGKGSLRMERGKEMHAAIFQLNYCSAKDRADSEFTKQYSQMIQNFLPS